MENMETFKEIENKTEVKTAQETKLQTLDIDSMGKEELLRLIATVDLETLSKSDQRKIEQRISDTGLLI